MNRVVTLKGVFPGPPSTNSSSRRDFLKENKLKVKELGKNGNNCNKNNQKQKSPYHQQCLQQFHPSQSHDNVNKLRITNTNSRQSQSNNHHHIIKSTKSSLSTKSGSISSIKSSTRTNSRCTIINPIKVCDKQIQTDEISDELFLSEALKRCISSRTQISSDPHHIHFNKINGNLLESISEIEESRPQSTESININSNYYDQDQRLLLTPNDEIAETLKKSPLTVSIHRKNQSNIKIPNYLLREKRDKELQKLRELSIDPNCPKNHYLLDENSRREALEAAQQQFQKLVDELNKMPLRCETLKLRSRKIEIEKSLTELEMTIKKFSKPKVYIRFNEI